MIAWKNLLLRLVPLCSSLIVGCAQQPYDYSALENSKPRSILVIPPMNDSIEVNAPYIFLSTISKPLAEKGYYVFPVAVIDQLLKENGLQTPADMHQISLNKIAEYINPDAILYVTIDDWGQKYKLLSSTTVVSASMELVDTKTGGTIWDAKAIAQKGSSDEDDSLGRMLTNAIIAQIAGSITDQTPDLARMANQAAINDPTRGLLNGPYRLVEPNK